MASEIRTSKKLVFTIVILVLFLLLLEAAARVYEYAYPEEIDIGMQVAEKKPGTFRIFLYGGSTVLGEPEGRFGFVNQFLFRLSETHPDKPLDVINFAVSGKDSTFVRTMVENTMSLSPDLIIVLSGHNEFLLVSLPKKSFKEKLVYSVALTRVLFKFKESVSGRVTPARAAFNLTLNRRGVIKGTRSRIERNSKDFESRVSAYRENIKAIAGTAEKNSVPLILLTAPYNMADWPPVYKGFKDSAAGYEADISEVMELIRVRRHKEAGLKLVLFKDAYPEDAMYFFMTAKLMQAGGDYPGASLLFKRAKDMDPMPWRVLSGFNKTVREVAASAKGTYLVDVENLFEENSKNGLVGFDLIADNCHPTPLGSALIAEALYEVMEEQALFVDKSMSAKPGVSVEERLEFFLTRVFSAEEREGVEYNYLLNNIKYTMKSPFYNFAASKMYLDRAYRLNPSDWRVWGNKATISLFEGDTNRGMEELEHAASLKGRPLDVKDRANTPHLYEALKLRGISTSPVAGELGE